MRHPDGTGPSGAVTEQLSTDRGRIRPQVEPTEGEQFVVGLVQVGLLSVRIAPLWRTVRP